MHPERIFLKEVASVLSEVRRSANPTPGHYQRAAGNLMRKRRLQAEEGGFSAKPNMDQLEAAIAAAAIVMAPLAREFTRMMRKPR
jgi:hypothetical protein